MKLNAKQLRTSLPTEEMLVKIERNPVYIVCDNVWDTYNIGAIFRLGDALSVAKIYICGESLTPPNPRIKKASVNTWQWVPWEYKDTAVEAVQELKSQKVKIVAVEQTSKSISFVDYDYSLPIALVVGNETSGVDAEVLKLCDGFVELPMYGINRSLNVMVSLGIALYEMAKKCY